MKKSIKAIINIILLTTGTNAFATEFGKMQVAASPYVPRVYLSGYGGSNWLGQFDLLAPVFVRDDKNLFLYGQGRLAGKEEDWEENTWVGSLGLGYRQMLPKFIVGGYVFADYNNSPIGNNFLTISPGLEAMGDKWDVRINGYFPVGTTTWNDTKYASEMGNYDYVYFTGHEQYDHLFQNTTEAAKYGFDGQVGYHLLDIYHMPLKVYLNGYHFSGVDGEDVNGIGGKITLDPIKYLTISLNESYDNLQGNTLLLGLRVNLSLSRNYLDHIADDTQLQARLFEPIERNFGTLGIANSTQSTSTSRDLGPQLEQSNIWFFSDDTTLSAGTSTGDGSYENPYDANELNQENIDQIATMGTSSYLYLSPGLYSAAADLELHQNQNLYGRSYDYTAPANQDDLPIIYGALTLDGNNVVDSIDLQNYNQEYQIGIDIRTGGDVTLNNIIVGNTNNIATSYLTAVAMDNANVEIDNSKLFAYAVEAVSANSEINSIGIEMNNGGQLTINNSSIRSIASVKNDSSYQDNGNSYGIHADGKSENIYVNNTDIYSDGTGTGTYSGNAYGILFGDNIYVNKASSNPNVSGNKLALSNNTIINSYAHNSLHSGGDAYGVLVGFDWITQSDVTLNISNNKININSSQIAAYGYSASAGDIGGDIGGNALGVAIGSFTVYMSNSNALNITTNTLDINESEVDGYGFGIGNVTGIGCAAMIGISWTELNAAAIKPNYTISYNEVDVAESQLLGYGSTNSTGTSYGFGEGLMVGIHVSYDTGKGGINIESNKIEISDNSQLTAISEDPTEETSDGYAASLYLGVYYNDPSVKPTIKYNTVTANDSTFIANPLYGQTAYGIYMPQNNSNNIANNSLNSDAYTSNYFSPDGNHGTGYAIVWPDGHKDVWPSYAAVVELSYQMFCTETNLIN